jgi:putative phosphoesterase
VIIGILSDTHDRAATMSVAIEALRNAGATYFIHCGDIGSHQCIDLLAGLQSAFVFGNCDFDRIALARYAELTGVPCYGNFADLRIDDKRFAVIHGDDYKLKQRLITAQEHDYLFQGHTHIPADERIGRTRLINPGALHRATQKTVATLDIQTDKLTFLTIATPP